MNKPFQHLIFDLGAVLLDIDYQRTIKAFEHLGLPDPVKAFSREYQGEIFQAYEVGQLSSEEFVKHIQEVLPKPVAAEEIIEAWCALLGEMPHQRVQLLGQLKRAGFRLYILSNTNALHQERFERHINERFGWKHFAGLFDGIFYSHQVGLRKPSKEIFSHVMAEIGAGAEACFFIDDTPEHVATAQSLGIHAFHLKAPLTLSDAITKYVL